ncbi:MAG: putative sugar O-methyltransferase [bacterium]
MEKSFKQKVLDAANSLLSTANLIIMKQSDLDRLEKAGLFSKPSFSRTPLPEKAQSYLRADNPRLKELQQRYSSSPHPVTVTTKWNDSLVSTIDLQYFRGDNPFIWQFRDGNSEMTNLLTAYYVKTIDKLGLLNSLEEDDLFGCYVFDFNGERLISRDLLDSIIEINFLDQALDISNTENLNILDIGAGYGRLAYRMSKALPKLGRIFCADGIAESTFLSEFYLEFRGVNDKATVVPLDEIEDTLKNNNVDIATNIHSFSECSSSAIKWWIDLIKAHQVKHLLVVPCVFDNEGTRLISHKQDGSSFDFLPIIESAGYRLKTKAPKFSDTSLQKVGVSPTHYHLFELS